MKKVVIYVLLSIIITALATMLVIQNLESSATLPSTSFTIEDAEAAVKQRLEQINGGISRQMSGFTDAVVADNYFSLKLYGENDRSALEVVSIAGRYLNAMGFDVLKVTDADFVIVSSAHFPASVGMESKTQIETYLDGAAVGDETIVDHAVLTYQVRKEFSISDYKMYALGGIEVNKAFFDKLTPCNKVQVFMKRGNVYKGMNDIRSISEIKDSKIIINDKEYFAARIPLASADKSMETSLFVILEK